MTEDKFPTVSQVFSLLNDWRHFPFYSLETRAAPFFAVFMREILNKHFGCEFHEVLIPEFPLRIGTLDTERERKQRKLEKRRRPSSDQSYNVDYVAFQEDKSTAYLVELKTDMDSIRLAQMDYLCKAREKKFPSLVEGVKKFAQKSNKKQKYINLLHRLSSLGIELVYIRPDSRIFDKTFDRVVAGWTSEQKNIEVKHQNFSSIKVVYVQPRADNPNKHDFEYIYFDEVANIVERQGDLGSLFAHCLLQWKEPAGSRNPKDLPLPP